MTILVHPPWRTAAQILKAMGANKGKEKSKWQI